MASTLAAANQLLKRLRQLMRFAVDEELRECSSHGLQKLIATRLAMTAYNENEINSILRWKINTQAPPYTKAANRAKLADQALCRESANDDEILKQLYTPCLLHMHTFNTTHYNYRVVSLKLYIKVIPAGAPDLIQYKIYCKVEHFLI